MLDCFRQPYGDFAVELADAGQPGVMLHCRPLLFLLEDHFFSGHHTYLLPLPSMLYRLCFLLPLLCRMTDIRLLPSHTYSSRR